MYKVSPEDRSLASTGPIQTPSFEVGKKEPLEEKTEEVADKAIGGELPPPFSPISQHNILNITKGTNLLPKDLRPEDVRATLMSILKEKNISSSGESGIEAVASYHLTEEMNRFLDVAGYPTMVPDYQVQSVRAPSFEKKVDIIFSMAGGTITGATITGITEEQLPVFLNEVPPELHEKLSALEANKKLSIVSDETIAGIKNVAADLFSQIATELRDRLESEGPSKTEKKAEELEKGIRGEPQAGMGGPSVAIQAPERRGNISPYFVRAAATKKVAFAKLFRTIASGIWIQQMRAKRHAQKEQVKKAKERKEQHKEEVREDVQKSQSKHDDIAKAAKGHETGVKTSRGVKGVEEFNQAVNTSTELESEGVRTPPPSTPRK